MRGEGQPDHERHQRHLCAPGNRGLHRGPQPQRALPLQLQLLQLSCPARREWDFHRAAHLHHPGILHCRGHRQFLVPGHAPQLQRGHADCPQCHPGGSGRATGGAASASQLQRAGCSRSLTPRTSEWDPASIAPKSQGYSILLPLRCWPGCAGPPPKSQGHPQIPCPCAPGPALRGSTCWLLWEGASPGGNLGQFLLPVNPRWDAGVRSHRGSGIRGGLVAWSDPNVCREPGGSPEHLPRLVPCWLYFILGINALSGLVSPEFGNLQHGSFPTLPTFPSESCCLSGKGLILPDLGAPALS